MAWRHIGEDLKQKVGVSDITQQAMTNVVENLEQFRGEGQNEFKGWIKQIVVNEIHRTRRRYRTAKRDISKEQKMETASRVYFTPKDPNHTPSSEAMAVEQIENFYRVLNKLPPDYAEVIKLRSLEQLPFNDVATRMDKTLNSVTKLWYRAVLMLEEQLQQHGMMD